MRAKIITAVCAVCAILVIGTDALAKGDDAEKETKKAPAAEKSAKKGADKKANAKKGAAKKAEAKKDAADEEDKDAEAEKALEEAESKAEGKDAKKSDGKATKKPAGKAVKKPDGKAAKKPDGKGAKKTEKGEGKEEEEKPAAEEKKEEEKPAAEEKKEESPAEEPASEEAKPAEEAKPTIALPPAVKKFNKLWEDACQYRAADIRFHERMRKLLEKASEADALTAPDNETAEKLAQLANDLAGEYEALIKRERWLGDARGKMRDFKSRARTYSENSIKMIKLAIERREKEEAEKRAAEEKAAAEAAAKERLKQQVVEEQAKAQEAFDGISSELKPRNGRVRFDWGCTNQLVRLRDNMETREGKAAMEAQIQKIKFMEGMQKHFVRHAGKFVFKDRRGVVQAIVMKVDDKSLTIQKAKFEKGQPVYEKGKPVPEKKETRIEWGSFFGLKDRSYLNYMDQFINGLVRKGRERTRIGPKEWSEHMLGAALTLQYLYGEEKGVDKLIPELVKEAVKGFEPCRKWAVKWFPDVELPEAEDPVE